MLFEKSNFILWILVASNRFDYQLSCNEPISEDNSMKANNSKPAAKSPKTVTIRSPTTTNQQFELTFGSKSNMNDQTINEIKRAMLAKEEEDVQNIEDEDDALTNSASSSSAYSTGGERLTMPSARAKRHSAPGRRSDGTEAIVTVQPTLAVKDSCANRRPSVGYVAALSDMTAAGESAEGGIDERETWPNKFDFLMALTGYAVGFGNVWRFPYLCFKNGGGAFLIPYFICALLAGVPVFFLEVAIGQFMSEGTITVWRMVPIFKGIGYGTVVIVTLLNVYYIVIMAWVLAYLFQSFNSPLPWEQCDQWWNSPNCFSSSPSAGGRTNLTANLTRSQIMELKTHTNLTDSVEEYWKHRILQITTDITQMGGMRWELVGTLALSWALCYFIIWKGTKSSSKVVYFTALFPYAMLLILFIRGITLPGAGTGIYYYLTPNFSRLLDAGTWIDAGTQIFFSYAVCTSAVVAVGSYNKFHHDCWRDSMIICVINSGTSFFAGFVIFSVLGHMAHVEGTSIEAVTDEGAGLAFVAYPKALSTLPGAPFWAVTFFVMMVLLGIDSMFVGVEGFVTAVMDIWPRYRKAGTREIFIALVCFASFLAGLPMVTQGGMYVFQLFDYYSAASYVLLWFCFFECIAIGWIYGADRFYDDIERMIGYRIHSWIKWCWCFFSPAMCVFIFIFGLVKYEPLKYGAYEYPAWADALGWIMALSSMIWIPLYAIWVSAKAVMKPGEKWKNLSVLLQPDFSDRHLRRIASPPKRKNTITKNDNTTKPVPLKISHEFMEIA